jgi:hypothetical protein
VGTFVRDISGEYGTSPDDSEASKDVVKFFDDEI